MASQYYNTYILFVRAEDLGHAKAYNSIGYAYDFGNGRGVEMDNMKKANHYYELAAMRGNLIVRCTDDQHFTDMDMSRRHYNKV